MSPWPSGHVKKSKVVSIRLTDAQYNELQKIGKANGANVRGVIARIVEEYLEKRSKSKKG
jgi:predicted DNA-binding ribbon-helix-helix protein